MKGLGNYRFHRRKRKPQPSVPRIERRPAVLLEYRGSKGAVVRFHDGQTYGMPAEPLKKIGVQPRQRFFLVVTRLNGVVQEVRVEAVTPPRPARARQAMPKVVVRDGKKLTTRK